MIFFFLLFFSAAVICLLILKTHRSALFNAFGIHDRHESSSVALITSAEHTDESAWSARHIHQESSAQTTGCQH